jgi:hypothetical protein
MCQVFKLNFINFFYNKTAVKKCSSKGMKGSLVFTSIKLVMELSPEDVVFHHFYMNKTGFIKSKAKKASVLDEDIGELLPDDGSDDEMLDLGEDLLRDDSDVELGTISYDSTSDVNSPPMNH